MVPVEFATSISRTLLALLSILINYSFSVGITTNVKYLLTPRTAFLNTAAAINLIKLKTFKELSVISSNSVIALPLNLDIHGISGYKVLRHGKVYLTLILPEERNITAPFYIVSQVSLQADFLIGLLTMRDNNLINIFPAQNQICQRDSFIPALPLPPSNFVGVIFFSTRDRYA